MQAIHCHLIEKWDFFFFFFFFKGVLHPNEILACFVLYLKIINTILKNDIVVYQVMFKLWIKTVKILFWSQEPLGLLKF